MKGGFIGGGGSTWEGTFDQPDPYANLFGRQPGCLQRAPSLYRSCSLAIPYAVKLNPKKAFTELQASIAGGKTSHCTLQSANPPDRPFSGGRNLPTGPRTRLGSACPSHSPGNGCFKTTGYPPLLFGKRSVPPAPTPLLIGAKEKKNGRVKPEGTP